MLSKTGLALALGTMMLLAGCVSIPDEAPTAASLPDAAVEVTTAGLLHGPDGAILDPAAAPGFVQAVGGQYSLGVDATEPTIGVDAEGIVYMTGFGKNAVGRTVPTVMRSTDKGQTWEDKGPGTHPLTHDPYVFVDVETGRVFTDDIAPLSCGMMSWSDDQGESWTTNPYSCGNSQVNDHQTFVTATPRLLPTVGYPKLVYRCVNNGAYAACAISQNGGLTFTPQIPVYTLAEGCSTIFGHLRADFEGRVYLPKADCHGAGYFVTEDDGLSWTWVTIDTEHPAEGHDLGLAIDEVGNLYATWNSEGMVYLSTSQDHGATWSKARNVVAPGVTATMFNTVATGGVGKIAFAYVGSTIPGGYEGKPSGVGGLMGDLVGEPEPEEWANATWNGYIGVITDALSDDFTIQTVTANDPADPLARGLCGRTRCHGMNDFIDMVVDGEGRPWVAFVDVCTQECVTDPTVKFDQSIGFAGTLVSGPALVTGGGVLAPILPPPAAKAD